VGTPLGRSTNYGFCAGNSTGTADCVELQVRNEERLQVKFHFKQVLAVCSGCLRNINGSGALHWFARNSAIRPNGLGYCRALLSVRSPNIA